MLITHDTWLHRSDFRRSALLISDDGPELIGVDWTAVHELTGRVPASGSELAMLNLASSLAGQPSATSLGDLLTGLDINNLAVVLHAIAHAAGWHERGTVALVTGLLPGEKTDSSFFG